MSLFIVVIQVLLSGYLIFAALTGKSRIFQSQYVKDGKETQYRKAARIGFLVIAGLLLVVAVFNILMYTKSEQVNAYVEANQATLNIQASDTVENILARLPEEISQAYYLTEQFYTISQVLTGLVLTALVVTLVLLRSMQDRKKRAMPTRSVAPRAAFYFDEDKK